MRITREMLLKVARDAAAERVRLRRSLLCIYLCGSLLTEEPLLGGSADIDLFLVYDSQPPLEREIVPVSNEVHLDIAHFSQRTFSQPRQLRVDPWLGSFIYEHPILLHDTAHWFDFTQASLSSQFNQPENILQRASGFSTAARQGWSTLKQGWAASNPAALLTFLKTIEQAANAIACLSGTPLTERRFILQFPRRAAAVGRPGLAEGLVDLFASHPVAEWSTWLEGWQEALSAAAQLPEVPPRLHPCRQVYYRSAIEALREQHPQAALWLLLRTWTLAASLLPQQHPALNHWQAACHALDFDDTGLPEHLNSLDSYLDSVEETLELWGRKSGALGG